MISEKTFIKYYSSFWDQLLPGADHYLRMINSGLKERIFPPITIEDIPVRRALISSMAYNLFYKYHKGIITKNEIDLLDSESPVLAVIKEESFTKVSSLSNSDTFNSDLTVNEIKIVLILANRLCDFLKSKKNIKVYPKFQGCGLLFDCYGDLKYDKTLVEIKAGESNFSKFDIYQLITYGTLDYANGSLFDLQHFELLNIRTGVSWIESIETVCEIIAGCSSVELYSEITNFISNNYRSI